MWIEVPFTKNPADQDTLAFRYNWLVNNPTYAGYSLYSYSFMVLDSEGVDQSDTMIVASPLNNEKFIWVTIGGGSDLNDYYLKATITFTKSGFPDFIKEWEILIQVRQEGI